MTLETMEAVVHELVRRGVSATLEYPGFMAIYVRGTAIHYGDANETLAGDVMSDDLTEVLETMESSIPSSCDDIQRIADHIACDYTTACEV